MKIGVAFVATVILLIIMPTIGSDSVVYTATITVENQARHVCWNHSSDMFGVANKNNYGGYSGHTFLVYSVGNYVTPLKEMTVGTMALDYAWSYPYVAMSQWSEDPADNNTFIFDISDDFSLVRSFDTSYNTHTLCYVKNGDYLLTENLTFGGVATICVINCSSSNPDDWHYEKTLGTNFGIKVFNIVKSPDENYLLFTNDNSEGIVYVWNITSNDPDDWSQMYTKSSSTIRIKNDVLVTPNNNFFICDNTANENAEIYWLKNGTHYKTYVSTCDNDYVGYQFDLSSTVDTAFGITSGYIVGAYETNKTIIINMSDWSDTTFTPVSNDAALPALSYDGTILATFGGTLAGRNNTDIYAFSYGPQNHTNIQFISINGNTNGTTIYNSTPTINWTIIADTSQYHLEIDNNADFSSPEINITDINQYNYPSNCDINSTRVSFTLPTGLTSYDTYYMRVRTLSK